MFRAKSHRRWPGLLCLVLTLISTTLIVVYIWLLADLPILGLEASVQVDTVPGEAPSPAVTLHQYVAAPSSKIYDRNGRLLFEMPPPDSGRHSPVPLSDVPEALRLGIIATEDASFYHNPGVDARAVLRAVWINLQGGEVLSGGSTITQQLARNLLLSPEERYEQTLRRKLRESILAGQLTLRFTKDQILELYLNEIYFGNMSYGVQAAAQAYFGKSVRDLDLAECAMLAGLPQAPALYNPLENLKAAKARQAVVLDLMVEQGYITAGQASTAKREKLYLAAAPYPIQAPHFVMYVRGLLEQELGLARLEQGGLEIYTTLDLELNQTARDLVRYRLTRLAECNGQRDQCPPGGHNVRNAALVALDPETGEILAMLGSPDYFSTRIDGAVNGSTALRQPGSSLKPITYAAAFEGGALTPASMMLDIRTSFPTREGTPYVPLNYDLDFRGPVRLREALASSYNLIAVKVLDKTGLEAMTGVARSLGITTLDDTERLGLAVTLGGGEVRLLELTAAYGGLANGGRALRPTAIRRVEDATGQVLWSSEPGVGAHVLDERVAYLITHILSDDTARIPSFGEQSVLALSRPAAVKTGTTTDFRDNWTVGYTPQIVVGVWVGNADNEPMHEISGISGAAPIWHDFMQAALKGRPSQEFRRPSGLAEVEVCSLSGLLPGPDCPHRITELFLAGTEPAQTCSLHQRISVDRNTGLRATTNTPPERIVQRLYTVLPPEALEWAREQGLPDPPPVPEEAALTANAPSSAGHAGGQRIVVTSPDLGAVYRLDPELPRTAQQIVVSALPDGNTIFARITILVDGQPLARFQIPPYRALWQLEPGVHWFQAEGATADGKRLTSQAVRVEVRQ